MVLNSRPRQDLVSSTKLGGEMTARSFVARGLRCENKSKGLIGAGGDLRDMPQNELLFEPKPIVNTVDEFVYLGDDM